MGNNWKLKDDIICIHNNINRLRQHTKYKFIQLYEAAQVVLLYSKDHNMKPLVASAEVKNLTRDDGELPVLDYIKRAVKGWKELKESDAKKKNN